VSVHVTFNSSARYFGYNVNQDLDERLRLALLITLRLSSFGDIYISVNQIIHLRYVIKSRVKLGAFVTSESGYSQFPR